jgi:hypothetical protein
MEKKKQPFGKEIFYCRWNGHLQLSTPSRDAVQTLIRECVKFGNADFEEYHISSNLVSSYDVKEFMKN